MRNETRGKKEEKPSKTPSSNQDTISFELSSTGISDLMLTPERTPETL
jgi:hypothetical protein